MAGSSWVMLIALTIILILLAVAIYYCWRLVQVRRVQQDAQLEFEAAVKKQTEEHVQSIRIIARAHVSGQVESPEACLRICGLLDLLSVSAEQRLPFVALDKMRDSIKHIPVKDKWLALTREERDSYRAQMVRSEEDLEDFIKPAMVQLQSFTIDKP